MGTTYTLLNEVIVPLIQSDRILVVINQADIAMKGRHWDQVAKQPDSQLIHFLDEQAASIQRRVKEATGVNIYRPVYYSAEYGYNVDKLFDFIISLTTCPVSGYAQCKTKRTGLRLDRSIQG